jgi:4-hydroxy-3-methylbut-2-en-1-yl diphosphate synthase IspG/GcpE
MIVNPIKRRPTRKIRVGSVYVGGDAPISVQSMTNTETCDVDATVAQIQRCADAGADIMRVSVPSMELLKLLVQFENAFRYLWLLIFILTIVLLWLLRIMGQIVSY